MNTEKPEQSSPATENEGTEQKSMSRRQALAIVGKHAVYTAPAVLAVLAVTKSKGAHADTSL
jgi:hypothetical protein